MARTRPEKRKNKAKRNLPSKTESDSKDRFPENAQSLLDEATSQLHHGEAEQALMTASKLLKTLSQPATQVLFQLPAFELLGEIHLELGDPDAARNSFLQAAALDPEAELPEEAGGGADKFLWLAQLSEEGGQDSVDWFQRGITALRRDLASDEQHQGLMEEKNAMTDTRKRKLASALCGAAEVYMTDLSWEENAEARCEALVTEACVVAPNSPEALQTLANVRLSQMRREDAKSALERSIEIWTDLPEQHPDIPAFPTRISLARLLMEAEMEDRALDVCERLVAEDDSSVEAWYLGGWCLRLLADKPALVNEPEKAEEYKARTMKSSRDWLGNGLRLFSTLDYEDDRLRDHAQELVAELDGVLGPDEGDGKDDEDDGWEDVDDESDENMEE